jgi:hypothetical protein
MRLSIKSCTSYNGLSILWKKISAWAPNEAGDLTRVPMFGKSLPLDNDTAYSRWKVLCRNKWVRT